MPKLTHPNAPKVVIEPGPEYVEAYKSQGWVEVAEKPAEKPALKGK